jgi:hypothetical protein
MIVLDFMADNAAFVVPAIVAITTVVRWRDLKE